MIKLLGAIIILIVGLLISCTPLLNLTERMRILTYLIRGLEQMKAELSTNAPTIPQLMNRMKTTGTMFETIASQMEEAGPIMFYEAWHISVDSELLLTEGEQNAMHSLGDTLGRYVMEEQLAAIERTIPILMEGYRDAKERFHGCCRLYIGMGLSMSAMLVVVLL